jgi:hypothetical protein
MKVWSSSSLGLMLKKLKKIKPIVLFLLIVFLTSFKPHKAKDSKNSSVVFVKLNSYTNGNRGFGGSLKIRNIQTDKVYKSPDPNGYNYTGFVFIKNVPNGEYIFEEVTINTGFRTIILQDPKLFQKIKIDEPMMYFLGHYHINKLSTTTVKRYEVLRQKKDSDEKVFEEGKGKLKKWDYLKINNDQGLFLNDSIVLNFENKWH